MTDALFDTPTCNESFKRYGSSDRGAPTTVYCGKPAGHPPPHGHWTTETPQSIEMLDAMARADSTAEAHARRTDPDTSHAAAKSVGDLRKSQAAVLGCLDACGPCSDEALLRHYRNGDIEPRQSDSGIRSRRKELVVLGLVKDSGARDRTAAGRATIVWEAVAE